jgi:hypothetical protein
MHDTEKLSQARQSVSRGLAAHAIAQDWLVHEAGEIAGIRRVAAMNQVRRCGEDGFQFARQAFVRRAIALRDRIPKRDEGMTWYRVEDRLSYAPGRKDGQCYSILGEGDMSNDPIAP